MKPATRSRAGAIAVPDERGEREVLIAELLAQAHDDERFTVYVGPKCTVDFLCTLSVL